MYTVTASMLCQLYNTGCRRYNIIILWYLYMYDILYIKGYTHVPVYISQAHHAGSQDA
jgi:3-deoxy-D-arabino-heptulosonate 7-phosphate (DAHP) synthase